MKVLKVVLKIFGGLLVFLIVGAAAVLIAARFADGPNGIIAGGAFTSGELHVGLEPDWSFVHDIPVVEFQSLDPERSRTTWIIEVEGRIFIPCGYMNTTFGRIWKQWPIEAERDGRVILRIGDTLYERSLVRLNQGAMVTPVLAELSRKYGDGDIMSDDAVTSNSLWIFELAPRLD